MWIQGRHLRGFLPRKKRRGATHRTKGSSLQRDDGMATRASRAEALHGRGGNGPATFEGRVRRWVQQEVPAPGSVSGTRLRWTTVEPADATWNETHAPRARDSEWEALPVLRPSHEDVHVQADDLPKPPGDDVAPTPMETSAQP